MGDVTGVALRPYAADPWHQRVRYIKSKSLDILRKVQRNCVVYNRGLQACDVCSVGKRVPQALPKRASQDVKRLFPLVTTDLMGRFPLGSWGISCMSKSSSIIAPNVFHQRKTLCNRHPSAVEPGCRDPTWTAPEAFEGL